MKKRGWRFLGLFLACVMLLAAVSGCGGESETGDKPTIVVGSKTFTEALLLGQMTYEYLKELGYDVEDQIGLGELAIIRPALESGGDLLLLGVYRHRFNQRHGRRAEL